MTKVPRIFTQDRDAVPATLRSSLSCCDFVSVWNNLTSDADDSDLGPGYLNLRMVIHAVFMIDMTTVGSDVPMLLQECQCRCIQAAEDAIDVMYSTFCTDDYFQTWYVSSAI